MVQNEGAVILMVDFSLSFGPSATSGQPRSVANTLCPFIAVLSAEHLVLGAGTSNVLTYLI